MNEFFTWLVYGGGSIMAVSFILERFEKYQELSAETKKWVFFIFAAVLSLGSYAIVTFVPSEVVEAINPFFAIISGLFYNLFLGKSFHAADKKPSSQ